MKSGRRVLRQLTYQFEVPATDFRKDKYHKLLANKKVKNFILRLYKRKDSEVFNGYITSLNPVLITTFKIWLDCTDRQLWPAYPTNSFLTSQKDNPNIVFYKFNGVEEPTCNDEYIVEPIDFEDIEVDEEETNSDEDWNDIIGSDVDEGGKHVSYREETIRMAKALKEKEVVVMENDDIEHYVQYCHRRNWDVNKWINWIWGAYAVHIRGNPTRYEIRDYKNNDFTKN